MDWSGEIVWEWGAEAPGGAARQNHDWELLPNGNRLLLVTIRRVVAELGPQVVGDQGIYEVSPAGEIVWTWRAGDHLAEFGFSDRGWEYLRGCVARRPDDVWGYLELNSIKTLGPNRWHRVDPETVFQPDHTGHRHASRQKRVLSERPGKGAVHEQSRRGRELEELIRAIAMRGATRPRPWLTSA